MSIYDKASLVLIPSGTKTSKVYSQVPTNGDGDFTFSRSTAATRVNASGNIEKETQNLLTYSNAFSTSLPWAASNTSLTGGQGGYDGTNDAWKLVANTSTGSHYVQQVFSVSGVRTISIYAKPSGYDYMLLYSGGNGGTFFDLVNGTITNNIGTTPIDATITSAGNGFYRCSIVVSAGNDVSIWPSPDGINYNYTGDGTSGILIQDAQLEQGLVARDYIETTTTAIYGGITDNVPRLDYTDSSCPALLLEPQRTNVIENSEYSAGLILVNVARTQNSTISPEGVQNATTIASNTAAGPHYFGYNQISVTSGTSYSASLFVKKGTGRYFQLLFGSSGFGTTQYANFDLEDGVITYEATNADAEIVDYGNGWYRCSITSAASANTTETYYGAVINSATASRVGGHTDSLDYYIYGAQYEVGSYATSYIPTYGSAVTRERDNCDLNDVTNIRGDRKGTIYVEGKISTLDTAGIMPLTYGGGTANLIYLWLRTNGQLIADIYTDNVYESSLNTSSGYFSVGDSFKIAVAYQDNDAVLYINGTLIESDDNLNAPNPNLLRIGKYNAAGYTGGSYTNAMVFPTRLSNEELATLTTI